ASRAGLPTGRRADVLTRRPVDPLFRRFAVLLLTALLPGCAGRPPQAVPSAPRADFGVRPCRLSPVPMEWLAPAGKAVRLVHDSWCDTVGPPAFRTPDILGEREAAHEPPGALTIVSWNTHGGVADIDALLQALRARTAPVTTQVVLLLQEVVRRSPSVPPSVADAAPVPGSLHGPGHGEDVADLAARLGLSLVYVPSMRNGDAPDGGRPAEDRGNAILSSLPLTSPVAIELPLTHQRRVAVAATVGAQVKGVSQMPLRVVSFHLDTTGGRGQQAAFLGDWLRDEAARRVAVVAGGDVNALWGTR